MNSKETIHLAAGTVLAAGIGTSAQLFNTVALNHGRSHLSNGVSETMSYVGDHINYALGTSAAIWIGPHVNSVDIVWQGEQRTVGIGHHGTPDVNFYPSYRYELLKREYEKQPTKYQGFPQLKNNMDVVNFDPYSRLTEAEIRHIGSFSIAIMDGLLGERHEAPTSYTFVEAAAIVDESNPKYLYQTLLRPPKDRPLTSLEIAERLLSDPYSPSLYPTDEKTQNGVRGIMLHDVASFRRQADTFVAHPELLAAWIRAYHNFAPQDKRGIAYLFGGAIALGGVVGIAKKGLSPEVFAYMAAGATAAGAAAMAPIAGGAVTNSLGHLGELTVLEMINAIRKNLPFHIKPNANGSVTTTIRARNITEAVFLRTIDAFTMGEVIGQGPHHHEPWRRTYAHSHEPKVARLESPSTYNIESASRRKHLRFGLRPGEGHQPDVYGFRPDDPNQLVVDIIWPARVRTMHEYAALSKVA